MNNNAKFRVLFYVIVAPILEELLFRSYLWWASPLLLPLIDYTMAVCFVLWHLPDHLALGHSCKLIGLGCFFRSCLALLLGLTLHNTGSVFVCMLVHGSWNTIVLLLDHLTRPKRKFVLDIFHSSRLIDGLDLYRTRWYSSRVPLTYVTIARSHLVQRTLIEWGPIRTSVHNLESSRLSMRTVD